MSFANYIKTLYNGDYPDIGQAHYVVDSDYRTIAQGWARPDRTGPLDLFSERNPGYVWRTGDYPNDATAIQAAIDAAIDFRGDMLVFTPGAYSIGTALAVNVAGLRVCGPPVRSARQSRVILTDTVGDHVLSVDDLEFAFLQFVPLTAQNVFSLSAGADNGYIHHCFYNAGGVAASTATEWFNGASTTSDWRVEECDSFVDAAQGDLFTLAGAQRWAFYKLWLRIGGGTWASAFTFTGASRGNNADLIFTIADSGSSLLTNLFTGAAGANMLNATRIYMNGTLTPTATNIETGFDATTGIDIAECYVTGDATTQGGTLVTLA